AEAAGLSYDISLHWNVIPWWVANPAKGSRSLPGEASRARHYLTQMLHLLPASPAVVVLVGRSAQTAWASLADHGVPERLRSTEILECPHTSPLAYPRGDRATGRKNSDIVIDVLGRAAELAHVGL